LRTLETKELIRSCIGRGLSHHGTKRHQQIDRDQDKPVRKREGGRDREESPQIRIQFPPPRREVFQDVWAEFQSVGLPLRQNDCRT